MKTTSDNLYATAFTTAAVIVGFLWYVADAFDVPYPIRATAFVVVLLVLFNLLRVRLERNRRADWFEEWVIRADPDISLRCPQCGGIIRREWAVASAARLRLAAKKHKATSCEP